MKSTTILILLLQFSLFAQKSNLELDNNYFLLGTLSDYMGRTKSADFNHCVERLNENTEKTLILHLDTIFKKKYTDYHFDSTRKAIFSEKLSNEVNAFYDFKSIAGYTMNYDTIYRGTLKQNIFNTELQKISFIAGIYSRFGEINKEEYFIRLLNSTSKFSECLTILKQLGCTDIKTIILKNIPLNQIVYFEPSKKLKEYLNHYKYFVKRRKFEMDRYIEKMSNDNSNIKK